MSGQSTMTPEELRTQLENLIDNEYDVTHTYQLLTQAKNLVERMMKLAILQASDATQTASAGDTYTSLKSVASDFREMIALYVGTTQYYEMPFRQLIRHKNSARRFYIDYKKMVQGTACLGLMGTQGSSQTITQIYLAKTEALTEANEEDAGVVLWPDEFQPLIPYIAARIYQANINPDDTAVRQAIAQDVEATRLWDAMVGWDHDIKLAGMNHQGGYADDVDDVGMDLGMM